MTSKSVSRYMTFCRREGQVNKMLALTRKKGESLMVGNNIEITVMEVRGDQIKIGITAPKEVPIYRKEVYLQIREENQATLQADGLEALKNLF